VGVGHVQQVRTVDLTIPAKVRDGLVLRLKGLGEHGEGGGEPGDLFLTIRLTDDDTYRVRGADIEADVPVAPWEAVFGTKVDVRTPAGVVVVTVPPDTAAGAKLRLRGQGLDDGRGGRGDFHVRVRLALPEHLTKDQRRLLSELKESSGGPVAGGAREVAS
jgi:DnaJ-class molecular chaperone